MTANKEKLTNLDIFIVGVGGQGVLTIADLICDVALINDLNVNFYPTKGMAQRGGFVKAQLRVSETTIGPSIPEGKADLLVSTELSESLKAVRYAKEGADYVLFADVWQPTEVMLGRAPYPAAEEVANAVKAAGINLTMLDPADLPAGGRANIFIMGALMAKSCLKDLCTKEQMEQAIAARWPKVAEKNLALFEAGFAAASSK